MSGCRGPGERASTASRVGRGVTGTILAVALGSAVLELARATAVSWRHEADPTAWRLTLSYLVPTAILLAWAVGTVFHAVRGTRPAHPFRAVVVAILITLVVVLSRGGGLGPIVQGEHGVGASMVLSMATIAVALAIHVVLHELGHVAAGVAAGWRFRALRLGPIVVRRDGDRLRAGWNTLRLRGALGSALLHPPDLERFERGFAVMILGGPLATVAATAASFAGARAVSPPATEAEGVLSFLLWHATFCGAFVAVMNLLPMRLRSGVRTDGAKAWLALTARTPSQHEALRFAVNASAGRRPRDWQRTAEALEAAADDPRHPEVRLAALGVALDTGEFARAEAILARGPGVAHPDDTLRQEFALQASLVASLVHGDTATARARLSGVGTTPMREYPLLAEAAAAAAEGRGDEARTLLARWREALDRIGHPSIRVGNEWAEERLAARLEAPRTDAA